MESHSETKHFPYTIEQLYTLVADVERYPEFIPWCQAIRILKRDPEGQWLEAQMIIGFKGIKESYTSRVSMTPPDSTNGDAKIEVRLVSGPFSVLNNDWHFIAEEKGSRIEFMIEFAFASKTLEKLLGLFFHRAVEKLVAAFSERADALYGDKNAM